MALLISDTDAAQPEDKGLPKVGGPQGAANPGAPHGTESREKLHRGAQPLPEANAEPRRPHGGSFWAPRNHCLPQMQEAKG